METASYFFRDTGVALGRSIRPVLRSRDTLIAVTLLLLPVAFVVLLVYACGRAIQTSGQLFLTLIDNKKGH